MSRTLGESVPRVTPSGLSYVSPSGCEGSPDGTCAVTPSECEGSHDETSAHRGKRARLYDWTCAARVRLGGSPVRSLEMFVYILASKTRVIYVGVTNDLARRVWEHRSGAVGGFTRRYGVDRLVYYEACVDPAGAIRREKQIKGWARVKKVAMIDSMNPKWNDLAERWFVGRLIRRPLAFARGDSPQDTPVRGRSWHWLGMT